MASAAAKKKSRQRTHRYTSNVFSMFSQPQIHEFKEAFNMIDQNRDGFIDKDDLIEMLTSLGKNPTDDCVDGMIQEAPGPINFTMFLTLFGDKMHGTDPEDVIMNAFACFDDQHIGTLSEERFREVMTTMGDRWSDDMVDELLLNTGCVVTVPKAPTTSTSSGSGAGSLFNYVDFIRTLKHGATKDDVDETGGASAAATSSSGGAAIASKG